MASRRYLHRSVPAWVRALLAALALCAALYASLLVGGAGAVGLPLDPVSWWPIGALAIVAALLCLARAARLPGERMVWSMLGLATLIWGGGFVVWAGLYETDPAPPYPSLSDALWLPF